MMSETAHIDDETSPGTGARTDPRGPRRSGAVTAAGAGITRANGLEPDPVWPALAAAVSALADRAGHPR
jgi:hypothetical protein